MKPVRVPDLRLMKTRGEKITVLTAYDSSMARLLDRAGIDVILVGDSAGMVVLGYDTITMCLACWTVRVLHLRGSMRSWVKL
jgi:ketopantoate hydroxymethyltransferase